MLFSAKKLVKSVTPSLVVVLSTYLATAGQMALNSSRMESKNANAGGLPPNELKSDMYCCLGWPFRSMMWLVNQVSPSR